MDERYRKAEDGDLLLYTGTYTDGDSEGVYVCRLDSSTGNLWHTGLIGKVENPSFLAIDSERRRLYAVSETSNWNGRPGGGVSAFTIQPSSGELSPINQTYSHGGAPCYLTLDHAGRHLLVANYLGGNIVVIALGADGALGEATDIVHHAGSSLHPKRQAGPHPHSIVLDPGNRFAFAPDLGLDKVMQYRFDPHNGRLYSNQQPWIAARPGSGPRHMVVQENGERAYVINELSSTVTAYAYDANQGTLAPLQTISTVPDGYTGENTAADLHLTPNGKILFGSNRGHDSIASFAVDPETGWLAPRAWSPSKGQKPRGFTIDPGGTILLVANQDSHDVSTFWIDYDQGALIPTGHSLKVPSPVCLKCLSVSID